MKDLNYLGIPKMDYRISYEHSLGAAPNDFIVHVSHRR
ncbi:hypothetical protein LMG27177_06869 [Paraburkholderia fynbosensis]|uniref:Uncharacterized protein n=1 Tax=Paraburkholderia fynbosensis TaxID=1200993 RepID=A0A6J5GZU2_9BURK|nr:hypothetical protein LMG27177_06869 [Paraburkholderia fynbosensis]